MCSSHQPSELLMARLICYKYASSGLAQRCIACIVSFCCAGYKLLPDMHHIVQELHSARTMHQYCADSRRLGGQVVPHQAASCRQAHMTSRRWPPR